MSIKRRQVLAGSAAGAVSLASGLASPAIAANEPIKVGYLPALTGPSSSTGIGINRGTELAVAQVARMPQAPAARTERREIARRAWRAQTVARLADNSDP